MGDLQRGDDVRKNWVKINEQAAQIRALQFEMGRLREAIQELRKRAPEANTDRFPYRTYWLPNTRRATPDADAWRKFRVQHGYVNGIQTDGCDDTDGEGTVYTELTVPSGVPDFYIWAEVTFTSGAVFTAAINGAEGGWSSFPTQPDLPDTYYALIAKVDTDTLSAQKTPIIRQFVYQDIFLNFEGGDGGDPRWA